MLPTNLVSTQILCSNLPDEWIFHTTSFPLNICSHEFSCKEFVDLLAQLSLSNWLRLDGIYAYKEKLYLLNFFNPCAHTLKCVLCIFCLFIFIGSMLFVMERILLPPKPICYTPNFLSNMVHQAYVESMRTILADESWKTNTTICCGLRDRWLDYNGIEDYCRSFNHKLVELPMVSSLPSLHWLYYILQMNYSAFNALIVMFYFTYYFKHGYLYFYV